MNDKDLWRRIAGYSWRDDLPQRLVYDSGKSLRQNMNGFRVITRRHDLV